MKWSMLIVNLIIFAANVKLLVETRRIQNKAEETLELSDKKLNEAKKIFDMVKEALK